MLFNELQIFLNLSTPGSVQPLKLLTGQPLRG